MKKNELLNLLYVERQRLSEQNSHIGWSIWILIGCIITLSWMLLEHYETSSMKSDQFCWSQIVTLMGDFITVAFALLLIKNYYNDKKNSFHFDRFDKSKLPIFIILDTVIAILLYIYHKVFSNDSIGIILTNTIIFYCGVKCSELYQSLKCKQQIPLLYKQLVYAFASIIILIAAGCKIGTHYNYYIINTKYALLASGIIIVLYILLWHIWNPIKKSIIAIDKLINEMIINEGTDTKEIYNNLIAIKIGYKYSQLYENKLQKIGSLLKKQNGYITLIERNIKKLEIDQNIETEELNKNSKLFNLIKKNNETSFHLIDKILSNIQKDLNHILVNEKNEKEINKLLSIINNNLSISKKKRELIETLLNKYETLLNKQVDKYQKMIDEQSKCQYYCRFANNKFLCYTHRCLYFFTKKWNSIKVFVEHYKWRRG